MNSDYFAILTPGLDVKIVFDEMVDPSLYSSLDSESPSGQLMYESLADFCLQSSGNMQKPNSNNIFQQQTQQHLPIQFNQHVNLPTSYDNSSLISPTVEELTFEDCCSEMLKLLDENDINSLVDINTSLQNEIENSKANFQALCPTNNDIDNNNNNNDNISTDYILNNFYDFDECNSLQENLLLNNNLTLAQLNSPEFALNSFDRTQLEAGRSVTVMPVEIIGAGNNVSALNTIIVEPKIVAQSISGGSMKREPDLFVYSTRGLNALSPEPKQIIFKGEGYDPMTHHPGKGKVLLSSTVSQNQLKSILKGNEANRNYETSKRSNDEIVGKASRQEGAESILEAYLLASPKELSKPPVQTMDTYEDMGVLWDICDEEEAVSSVSCDKKEVEKPVTRKARKHLDSETSVEFMTGIMKFLHND